MLNTTKTVKGMSECEGVQVFTTTLTLETVTCPLNKRSGELNEVKNKNHD